MEVDICLISIPWETRNLGIQSFQVSNIFVEKPDESVLEEAINKKIEEFGQIFVQARMRWDAGPAITALQRNGFYPVETVLVPYTNLKANKVLTHFIENRDAYIPDQPHKDGWEVIGVNKTDAFVIQRIKGIAFESFVDDRFHRDWQCDKEIANRRFSYWIDDLAVDSEVTFLIITHHDKGEGFMARKDGNLILGGLARQSVGKGVGKFFWLSVLEDMFNKGFSEVHTLISVNNIPVLNLYAGLGFKFKEPAVTFHYWHTL